MLLPHLKFSLLPFTCLLAWCLQPGLRAEVDEEAEDAMEQAEIQIQAGELKVVPDDPQDVQVEIVEDGADPPAEGKADDNAPSWLGVQLDMNEPGQFDEDEKPPPGVGITEVMEDGPAKKAGLKAFDRVLKIDDAAVNTSQELRTTVRGIKAGTEVKVLVLREDKEETIKVVLGKMPAQANLMRFQGFGGTSGKPDKVHFYNTPARPSDPSGVDVVVLRDGNRLEGQVRELTPALLKFHLQSGPEIDLDQQQIESVKLSGEQAEPKFSSAAMLREGGWLAAQDVQMKAGRVTLTMEGQPEVTMERTAVSEIFLQPKSTAVIYQGPSAQDGWKPNSAKTWKLTDAGWEAAPEGNGTLSKKFPGLPGSLQFSFDLTLAAELTTQFSLFGYRTEMYGGSISPGLVQFQINQGSMMITQFDGLNYFPIAPEGGKSSVNLGMTAGKPTHLDLYCNRELGLMTIHSNGAPVAQYKLAKVQAEDLPRAGRVVQFVGAKGMVLSNLALRPWYGSIPSEPAADEDVVLVAESPKPQAGPISAITAEGVSVAKDRVLKRKESMHLKFHEANPVAKTTQPSAWIETRHGSAFAATEVTFSQGQVSAQTGFAGRISLPLASVRSLAFTAPNGPQADRKQMDVLTFNDGQLLHGSFSPPVTDGVVKWKISAATQPLTFGLKEVKAIQLAAKSDPAPRPSHVVKLSNGDWLAGELGAADISGTVFKTAFHEALHIPADRMSSLYTGPSAAIVADGGSSRKPWKESANRASMNMTEDDDDQGEGDTSSYRYLDGGYNLQRYGVDFGNGDGLVLPIAESAAPVSVEFTLSGVENWISMQLKDQTKQVACTISCSADRVQVSPRQNMQVLAGGRIIINGGGGSSFQMPAQHTINDPEVRLQLVMDSRQHALHLYVERVKIGTVKIPDPWRAMRSLTLFPSTNGRSKFKISDVWISPWVETASSASPDLPWVALSNGDGAAGRVLRINGAELEVDLGELGILPLPTSRITSLTYPNSPTSPSKETYRVRLHELGVLTASECHVDEHRVILTTELGEFALPMELVKEIIFPKL